MAAGANVKAVQRMLGHVSAAMTLDVRGVVRDDLDAVADRLDAAVLARGADHLRTGFADESVTELWKKRDHAVDVSFCGELPQGSVSGPCVRRTSARPVRWS